jgi:hypothetical protein
MTGEQSVGQSWAAGGYPPGGMPPGGMPPGGMPTGGMPPGGMPPGGMPPGGYPPGGMPPGMSHGGAMVPSSGMGYPAVAQPPGAPSGPVAKKKGSAGLIIGLVVVLLLLAGGGLAAYFLLFSAPKPELVKYVPDDVEIYFEVPSLKKALVAFAGMDPIDDKELDPDKTLDDWVEGFANAFDLEEEVARDVLTNVESYAIAVRAVENDSDAAMLIKFGSASAVEKLLEAKRFDEENEIKGGKRYELDRKEIDDLDKLDKMSTPEKTFSFMGVTGEDQILVWWGSEGLMVFGEADFVEDIGAVIGGKASLEGAEQWKQAKFEEGAVAMGYVDAGIIGDFDPDVRKGYFNDVTPFMGSLRMADAGMIVTLSGQLAGNKMPDSKAFSAPAKVDLMNKLPAETVAYVAYSSKSGIDGKEAEKLLVKQVKDTDPEAAEELEDGLKELDKEYGVSLATLYDAIGDQGVLAITASDKLKIAPGMKPEDAMKYGGIALIQHVGDKDAAEKLVGKLKKEVFEKLGEEVFDIKKDGKGFVAKPKEKEEIPTIIIKFVDDHLVVAVGQKKTAEGIVETFEGKGKSLDGDAAHSKALAAFTGEPHAILWVDTGRITRDLLDEAKDLRKEMAKEGVPVDALILEGDDRMTSALALRVSLDGDRWNYHIDSLNTLAVAPIGGLVTNAALAGAVATSGGLGGGDFGGGENDYLPSDFDTFASGSDDIGVPECNAVVSAMIACAKRKNRPEQVDTAEKLRESFKTIAKFSNDDARKTCQEQIDNMKKFGCF